MSIKESNIDFESMENKALVQFRSGELFMARTELLLDGDTSVFQTSIYRS